MISYLSPIYGAREKIRFNVAIQLAKTTKSSKPRCVKLSSSKKYAQRRLVFFHNAWVIFIIVGTWEFTAVLTFTSHTSSVKQDLRQNFMSIYI